MRNLDCDTVLYGTDYGGRSSDGSVLYVCGVIRPGLLDRLYADILICC